MVAAVPFDRCLSMASGPPTHVAITSYVSLRLNALWLLIIAHSFNFTVVYLEGHRFHDSTTSNRSAESVGALFLEIVRSLSNGG